MEHVGDQYAFVNLIGGRGPTQHRMGLADRHKLSYICFADKFIYFFRRRILQERKGMGDIVLEADIADVRKPVSATLTEGSEELSSNVVEDASW